MGFVFPRAMPAAGPSSQRFEPLRVDLLTPETSGRLGSISIGPPLWVGDWTLGDALTRAMSDEWRAWLNAQEGSSRTFLGRDFERPFPLLYGQGFSGLVRAGGGAFDGSLTSWSQSIASDGQATLNLGGLPPGFALSAGDYVDFRWTTGGVARRSLVRILAPATASGGGSASVLVNPAVPSLTPGGAVAHLDNPACVMRLDPRQTQIGAMGRRRVVGGRLVGLQELLP